MIKWLVIAIDTDQYRFVALFVMNIRGKRRALEGLSVVHVIVVRTSRFMGSTENVQHAIRIFLEIATLRDDTEDRPGWPPVIVQRCFPRTLSWPSSIRPERLWLPSCPEAEYPFSIMWDLIHKGITIPDLFAMPARQLPLSTTTEIAKHSQTTGTQRCY